MGCGPWDVLHRQEHACHQERAERHLVWPWPSCHRAWGQGLCERTPHFQTAQDATRSPIMEQTHWGWDPPSQVHPNSKALLGTLCPSTGPVRGTRSESMYSVQILIFLFGHFPRAPLDCDPLYLVADPRRRQQSSSLIEIRLSP